MKRLSWALCPFGVAAALLAGGCSTASPPSVAQAQQAVQAADARNSAAHAPQAMKDARSNLAGAERAVSDGFPETADKLAKQAIAAAQYAQARSKEASEQAALNYVTGTGSSPILPRSGGPQPPAPPP